MDGHSEAPVESGPPAPSAAELPLLAHLDRLVEELHTQAPKALDEWDEEGIHRARVATRRLSAALALVKPIVGNKRRKALAKVLRKLRRRLGPLRDADVMLGHLRDLAANPRGHGAGIDWLANQLARAREAHRKASSLRGGTARVLAGLGAWHPVREQIVASAAAIDGLLADSVRLQLDVFVAKTGPMVDWMEGSPHNHDPHAVRIAGKALRYTLEMATAQGHPLPRSVGKTFKRMQELLGGWHDDVVLAEEAMRLSLETHLSHHDWAMQWDVLDVARITLRRSYRHLQNFVKLWEAKGVPLREAIRAAFPTHAPPGAATAGETVSESQTGRGPLDSVALVVPTASPPDEPSAAS